MSPADGSTISESNEGDRFISETVSDHQHDDHVHETRLAVEQTALEREGTPKPLRKTQFFSRYFFRLLS